jgi:hypothetical protein
MEVYFKIEISIEDLSDLTYQLPKDVILLIRIAPALDDYFGIVRGDYYSEILKNVPRRSVDSIEMVSKEAIVSFCVEIDKDPYERFYGNSALLQ